MSPQALTDLSPEDLQALPRNQTVFFFSVSPLEDFGPHLPFDTGLLLAEQYCQETARRLEQECPGWKGILMPSLPLGLETHTPRHFHLTVRPHVLRDWLVDASQSLIRQGFEHFVCFTGQLGAKQLTAIEEAGSLLHQEGWKRFCIWKKRPRLLSASSGWISFKEHVLKEPAGPVPVEHGGREDTALLLAAYPEKVRALFQSLPQRSQKEAAGYWGQPAQATADLGKEILKERLFKLHGPLLALWKKEKPQPSFFRSGYRLIPSHQSFFRSWLLVLAICFLFWLWQLL